MTNVIRSIGIKPGLLVGIIDIFKGWIVTFYSPLFILNNSGLNPFSKLIFCLFSTRKQTEMHFQILH